ncbi:hypothetical protein GGR55DRAFT_308090 [Xylaria sp. FL0064]|nr:hypothetical protein GGR55DRAFT_308090 [Xylaria sp. FL0064]
MAPSSKGVNPAPNYTVDMNRVQTQLEARLRIVRSFMPSRAPPQNTCSSSSSSNATKPTASFSALASTSTSKAPPTSNSNSSARQRHDAEESLFTETRAQDPNAGLGFGAPSKRSSERQKERSDQILRSRLLGRKRGIENNKKDASGRRRQVESSDDDEEPGRSGLGRAKKRVRREESPVDEQETQPGANGEERGCEMSHSVAGSKLSEPELEKNGARADSLRNDESGEKNKGNGQVEMRDDVQNIASPREDSVPGGVGDASEQQRKKRRKKKKKKDKSKEAKAE